MLHSLLNMKRHLRMETKEYCKDNARVIEVKARAGFVPLGFYRIQLGENNIARGIVYVMPYARRRGIGEQLIEEMVKQLDKKGGGITHSFPKFSLPEGSV